MYEKIWLKLAKFTIKLFYSFRVSKKKIDKMQNFVKNRPSFKILAILADETKMIINITKLSRKRERVIRYTTEADTQSTTYVSARQVIPSAKILIKNYHSLSIYMAK